MNKPNRASSNHFRVSRFSAVGVYFHCACDDEVAAQMRSRTRMCLVEGLTIVFRFISNIINCVAQNTTTPVKYENIGKELFVLNRKRLVKELEGASLALFNSNDTMPTNADGTMPFRQNNDLFYLTGVEQEESTLVICPDFPDKKYREVLFLREPNETLEKWEGHKLTRKEAQELTGIETVVWTSELPKLFHHMMAMGNVEKVYLNTNEHYRSDVVVETRDARFIDWCKSKYPLHQYRRVAPIMSKLRREKQKREIELMQMACDITAKGFLRVLKFLKPGVFEYEIEAEFIH